MEMEVETTETRWYVAAAGKKVVRALRGSGRRRVCNGVTVASI